MAVLYELLKRRKKKKVIVHILNISPLLQVPTLGCGERHCYLARWEDTGSLKFQNKNARKVRKKGVFNN